MRGLSPYAFRRPGMKKIVLALEGVQAQVSRE
jgi:hypothetical protein